jgi:hypothetical protein
VRRDVPKDFFAGDPLLFSTHPVRGALLSRPREQSARHMIVDVLKSGIYDLWAAVEAP